MVEGINLTFIVIAVLLILSVIASKISDRFGIPALVLFLVIGMLAGSEGVGRIYFDDPGLAQAVGLFALVIILFSGGLDSSWSSIRGVVKEALLLGTVGVLITAGVFGLAAHLLFGVSLLEGLLIGAITSSTDAAAVFSLLPSSGIRLKERLSALLEAESGGNDPMAVFLTVGMIELIQHPGMPVINLVPEFFREMIIGAVVGVLAGRLLLFLINRFRLGYEGLYPVLVLGWLLLAFGATSAIGGSGFLAVYLIGLVLSASDFLHKHSLSRFFQGIAWLMQIVMFLTLGLLVFPSKLLPVAVPGLVLAAVLILAARPLAVWLSLLPTRFSHREKAFAAWVGLRGAVPIILATYPRLAGLDQDSVIFHAVFFVVITSVLIQGTTIAPVARWLRVTEEGEKEPEYPLMLANQRGWHGILQEVVVQEHSAAVGKAIYQLGLPRDYLVVLIARGEEFLIPNGSVILKANDRMLGLAKPETQKQVGKLMEALEQG